MAACELPEVLLQVPLSTHVIVQDHLHLPIMTALFVRAGKSGPHHPNLYRDKPKQAGFFFGGGGLLKKQFWS